MRDDSSSWPEYISSPASLFPDSSDLVRTGEWDVHFLTAAKKSCKGSWMTLFYLLVLPWKMDVHKHIIIRGWSLRSWLPAPKHLTSRLHVRLFLSEGLQLGFQESFSKLLLSKNVLLMLHNSLANKWHHPPHKHTLIFTLLIKTNYHTLSCSMAPLNELIKYL